LASKPDRNGHRHAGNVALIVNALNLARSRDSFRRLFE
jgi:hypothetical protein